MEWDDLQAIINPCVLDLIEELIDRHLWMPSRDRMVVALWIIYAHVYRQFYITPRLAILSPDFGYAKSALLTLIQHLDVSTTSAALYQTIDSGANMVLLDEGDNLGLGHKSKGRLRAILNALTRRISYDVRDELRPRNPA